MTKEPVDKLTSNHIVSDKGVGSPVQLDKTQMEETMTNAPVDAAADKGTSNHTETAQGVASPFESVKTQSEDPITKEVTGIVNQILAEEEVPTDPLVSEKDDLQPKEKSRVSFAAPTFSLGLTQDGISAKRNAQDIGNNVAGDQLIKNFTTNRRSKRKLPSGLQKSEMPPVKQLKTDLTLVVRHDPVPKVDDSAFAMLLKSVKIAKAYKIAKGVTISRCAFMDVWEQKSCLANQLMDSLIFLVRDRFLEEFQASKERPIDFMESDFAVSISKIYPQVKKKSYKITKKVSKYVGADRQWCTEVDILYCPYKVDDYWIGLCIELSTHEIIVLLPDNTLFGLQELQDKLLPLAESLPHIITRCATNIEMKNDLATPFTINRYTGDWMIKRKGSHGIATMLLLELHASRKLDFTSKIDESCVMEAGKNYGIKLYEKYISPLPLRCVV
ncbi:hypothetical protein AALP_AA2G066000 [Arabis alpina]|uniref:Ubiquitin-like protease family profile domain-containing protein n=1 Tax=Arabis alpina TaxID=50452 RepID=A0A087HFQ2_ARAAL|nr:hypothetical protein AALP_AA2G066000 [Arabis alpina]